MSFIINESKKKTRLDEITQEMRCSKEIKVFIAISQKDEVV